MANVNRIERIKLEIERTKGSIESQQNRLRIMKDRLEKEKDKEVVRIVKERGLEPEELERLLRAYSSRYEAMQGKEADHAQDSENPGSNE